MNKKSFTYVLVILSVFVVGYKNVYAQTSQSASYVPLIGITSVPDPFVLPAGGGQVKYSYAVKNFVEGAPLTDVRVVDSACSPIIPMVSGEDANSELDYGEVWRYTCETKISTTTQSSALVTATESGITANDIAYATVVVGSRNPPPLVSIVNITKVAYPLSLPVGGGEITYTYKVSNPGAVPLSNVIVSDNKCAAMSGELGDINGNKLLDTNEVWIYTCTTNLTQTTTNTAEVTAYANGLKAVSDDTITVVVTPKDTTYSSTLPNEGPNPNLVPGFPDNGPNPGLPDNGINPGTPNMAVFVWEILGAILILLIVIFLLIRRKK